MGDIYDIRYIKIQLDNGAKRHKQRKLNNHVCSVLLFVSSGPRNQVEF